MNFFNIRNVIFWSLDFLKSSKVKKQYNEIKYSMESVSNNSSYLKSKIDFILNEAIENTVFYSNYKGKSIQEFPIIDKNIIRENTNSFLSRKYSKKELIALTTSGSTGTPFTTYQNKFKRIRNSADTIYFAEQGGYFVGKKLFYFKIWSEYNKKSNLLKFIQNITAIDVLNLDAELPKFFKNFNGKNSNIAFLGYVSAFETIIKFIESKKLNFKNFKVDSIITMSESLDDYTKSKGEEYFNCPVLSRYSNIENGILAQQTLTNKNNFTVNIASYYIEILNLDTTEVLPFGNLGRIIVTDYYNTAMPLIRYDTGDLGILVEIIIDGKKTLVLTHIEGRKLDRIFNTKGELISSYIVYKNMWKYTEILQYQFIQMSKKEYVFKVSCQFKFEREQELVNEFKSYLGEDADFKIEYVNEIPLLDSGKRKKVMNVSNQ